MSVALAVFLCALFNHALAPLLSSRPASAAIACSAISSDLSGFSEASKVYASATFTWFTVVALLVAVAEKDGHLFRAMANGDGGGGDHNPCVSLASPDQRENR